ncbi:MAG: hypothetical protein BD935_00035 [Marine Group III euryarchaeote CG-Epi1]|uniref:Aminotransferase class V domain-containing protein n=1 Tax=Marine Group III euryarchaeote CG-Epi1 TaxID=1888995 RepID=A0A1J5UA69_9ARCH|nr:MAG: hypothetical protein BD935_00035 [Marine Group III euryarchaeote CG-Epi1]
MFGPNTHLATQSVIDFSHRDKDFFNLYESLTGKFKTIFGLNNYDILFVPGSGTVGIESVFFSVLRDINLIGPDGVFKDKWNNFSSLYGKGENVDPLEMYCQLETSISAVFEKEGCIVDCISSFPYYSIPKNTKIFVTCSNKQLGSMPGLSIVGIRKDFWANLIPSDVFSYLNLRRYKDFSKLSQTPTTPPITIYSHLVDVLSNFDIKSLRNKINKNSELIVDSVGKNNVIGEILCPVITINKSLIPMEIAHKYELYGLNTSSDNFQIFTYSCDSNSYKSFSDDIKSYKSK